MEHAKVRFNESLLPVNEQKKIEKIRNTNGKGKVKIKSIIPINFPIKVLKDGKHKLIKNQEDKNSRINKLNEVEKIKQIFKSLMEVNLVKSNNILKSEYYSCHPENQNTQIENAKNNKAVCKLKICTDKLKKMDFKDSLTKLDNLKQIKKNNKYVNHMSTKNIFTKCNKKNITCDNSNEDNDIEIIRIINISTKPMLVQNIKTNKTIQNINLIKSKVNLKSTNEKKINICNKLNKGKLLQKHKENYPKTMKFNKERNELLTLNTSKILKETNATSQLSKSSTKKSKQKQKIQLIPYKKLKTPFSINNKNIEKQVKKDTISHAFENNSDIFIQPVTLIKNNKVNENSNLIKVNENSYLIKVNEKRNSLCKDLSCPEYNSTLCIMKKLKEIENKKFITNFKYLPSHNKISTALDFARNECLYKDLINLSVDDNNLKFKLIHNKYPEPRDKDIIPKLSDFYNPKYTEQYFVIIDPITPNPVDSTTLSAFTISNKIYMWKINQDNF